MNIWELTGISVGLFASLAGIFFWLLKRSRDDWNSMCNNKSGDFEG